MGIRIGIGRIAIGLADIVPEEPEIIPVNALLNDDGTPILNDDGSYILTDY